ncbi:Hpt domain-containing protein [Marinicauda algicola]|uniref:Hpt domain-containing protein n=1 Tax=Marinicauda algicola TaxID=2029849 RepID=A0A4S2H320_9PROT|nr:Hpt domain-containing protein [Marinicauda algicola]TGY89632.1 Hpt domain-containing protein [Marinicauda algicola]
MSQREKPIEIINPPNMLRVKVGGRIPAADPDAIARAEKALDQLSVEFGAWLGQEVEKLEAALGRTKAEGLEGEAGDALFTVAHDLRGLGSTYQFPLVTRIAASLARLIETPEKRAAIPLSLAEAHVHSIRAALNQNIRTDDDAVGRQLAEELETRVVALVGEPT